jgi:hypothetical protein
MSKREAETHERRNRKGCADCNTESAGTLPSETNYGAFAVVCAQGVPVLQAHTLKSKFSRTIAMNKLKSRKFPMAYRPRQYLHRLASTRATGMRAMATRPMQRSGHCSTGRKIQAAKRKLRGKQPTTEQASRLRPSQDASHPAQTEHHLLQQPEPGVVATPALPANRLLQTT